MFNDGTCPHCRATNIATASNCIGCGRLMSEDLKPKPTLVDRVKSAITKRGIRSVQKKELKGLFRQILKDWKVTDDEVASVNKFYLESELSKQDFATVRDAIFADVVKSVSLDRRITSQEYNFILHVAKRLGMSQAAIQAIRSDVNHFQLLYTIENNRFEDLPATGSSGLVLKAGERDYFTAAGSILEERVVARHVVSRSSGMSFRIMKGVTYRVGQSRGRIHSETGIVPISSGNFTVTNKRLIFAGDRKSVNADLAKLLDVEMFTDGLRFSVTNRQKPVLIQFYSPAVAEIFACYISRVLNQ